MVTIPEIEQRLADYVIRDPRQFMPSDYDLRGVAEMIADTSLEDGDRHDPDWVKAVKPLLSSHFAKINVFDLDWEPVQHGDDVMLVAVFTVCGGIRILWLINGARFTPKLVRILSPAA